jgi:hypothetical protein
MARWEYGTLSRSSQSYDGSYSWGWLDQSDAIELRGAKTVVDTLNRFGSEGWELVFSTPGRDGQRLYYFKRELA